MERSLVVERHDLVAEAPEGVYRRDVLGVSATQWKRLKPLEEHGGYQMA